MKSELLNDFCGSVQKRMGIGWETIIATLLPVVIEMLTNCFNKPSDLQAFAEGKRSARELAGLRIKCRRVVQEQGVRGVWRISAATSELQSAILDELTIRAGLSTGPDIWQQAMDEAGSV